MFFRPRWSWLAIGWALALLTCLSYGQAEPTAAQSPEPPLTLVTPDSPLYRPAADARLLMDQRRAKNNEPVPEPQTLALTSMNRATQLNATPDQTTALARTADPHATNAPAPVGRLTGKRIRALGETPRAAEPQALGPGCQSWLYNPRLTDGTSWYAYDTVVTINRLYYYSPPNSLALYEDNDGDSAFGNFDVDAFGQPFVFPTDANSFEIDYKINWFPMGASDHVYYTLYEVNASGFLSGFLFYNEVPKPGSGGPPADGNWYARYYASFFGDVQSSWKGKTVALVFESYTDGTISGGQRLDVLIDDVDIKLCSPTTVPTGIISGTLQTLGVTSRFTDSLVLLTYQPTGSSSVTTVDYAIPTPSGQFIFEYVGRLNTGDQYAVWYLNDGTNSNRLALWYGTIGSSYFTTNSSSFYLNPTEVKNQVLTTPAHEALVAFPVTFTWPIRSPINGTDQYRLCLYDTQTLVEGCFPQTSSNSYPVYSGSQLSVLNFQYGRRYAWYVRVYNSGSGGVGYSFRANAITFAPSVTPPPNNPPPPNTNVVTGTTGATWLVMIYIAGDNNLGDPARYPNVNHNLQGQFASLKQLANTYAPTLTLVTLTDFYDDSGTQFCHLKQNNTQVCQQLGEKDTSNPATLTYFITRTLTTFTATRKMLVISDHGHSVAGVAADETTSRTATMYPQQIRQAFQNAGLASNKLDILFYNVCLMGSLEAAFDAAPFVNYMVASSNELWVVNTYDRILPLLTSNATTTRNVAIGMVDAYSQTLASLAPSLFVSSAAYDLSKVAPVTHTLSALATTLSNNLALSRSSIDSIRSQVQRYDSSGELSLGPEDAFVDLRHLLNLLVSSSGNTAISNSANSVLTALGPVGGGSSLVIANAHKSGDNSKGGIIDHSNAFGLSVYFPNGNNSGGQPTLNNLYLNTSVYQTYINQTQWDEFLRTYISGGVGAGPTGFEFGSRPIGAGIGVPVYLPFIRR
jgi:hypothetical protein